MKQKRKWYAIDTELNPHFENNLKELMLDFKACKKTETIVYTIQNFKRLQIERNEARDEINNLKNKLILSNFKNSI